MTYKKEGEQAKNLQLVEIGHNKFAVELHEGNVRVNLTKMAKPFGKTPKDWLKSQPAKDYLNAISDRTIIPSADLVQIRKGGSADEQGTWANDYRIAMRFAQWLSVDFSIQVDDMLVNMMRGVNKPLALAKDATIPEDIVYPVDISGEAIQCYYTNGMVYARMSTLISFLGFDGWSGYMKSKLGEQNIIYVPFGKSSVPFGNFEAFRLFIKYYQPESFKSIAVAARNIYGVNFGSNQQHEPIVYSYTALQMLEIFELILDKPVKKDLVLEALKKGKLEGGQV